MLSDGGASLPAAVLAASAASEPAISRVVDTELAAVAWAVSQQQSTAASDEAVDWALAEEAFDELAWERVLDSPEGYALQPLSATDESLAFDLALAEYEPEDETAAAGLQPALV